MNRIEGWAAKDGLYLPKQLIDRKDSDKETLKGSFHKSLDSFINEHRDEREPFFVLFKGGFDHAKPNVNKQAFSYYEKRPPLIANSMVFFVDNQRGNILILWRTDSDKNVTWNTEFARKLKGTLRSRDVA
jgi:hypothetical protein